MVNENRMTLALNGFISHYYGNMVIEDCRLD